jgi:hypothetical protein
MWLSYKLKFYVVKANIKKYVHILYLYKVFKNLI